MKYNRADVVTSFLLGFVVACILWVLATEASAAQNVSRPPYDTAQTPPLVTLPGSNVDTRAERRMVRVVQSIRARNGGRWGFPVDTPARERQQQLVWSAVYPILSERVDLGGPMVATCVTNRRDIGRFTCVVRLDPPGGLRATVRVTITTAGRTITRTTVKSTRGAWIIDGWAA